jgi:drug/metabolite transporter (DMT)-like permease
MDAVPSLTRGRICIALAAVLWSTSGAFTKILTKDTFFALNKPDVWAIQIAFFRVLFAGLVLAPTLRLQDFSCRGLMLVAAGCFAVMNFLFVTAMDMGPAANAILLQYTAPMWMYLASIWWLREPADRRSSLALVVGLLGIAVIVGGTWEGGGQLAVIAIALGSGVTYAGVMICLRMLRDLSSRWLTVWNHLCGALALLPFMWSMPLPAGPQLACLVLFGALQMGLPYWLVTRGLRSVSPQEAGAITLLEPVLNPLWAFLVSPETETPAAATLLGGAMIVGGLVWRYWPRRIPPSTSVKKATTN